MSRVTESDERVLIEAAQKDPGRFAELYELNFHRVYAYVARRIHDRSETQDLTAYVFQQALANIGKFKWRGAPLSPGSTELLQMQLPTMRESSHAR